MAVQQGGVGSDKRHHAVLILQCKVKQPVTADRLFIQVERLVEKQGVQASFGQPDREERKARAKAVLEVLPLRTLPCLAQAAACLAAGQAPEGPFRAVIKLHDHRPAIYRQDGLNRCLGQIGYILLGELGA